MIIELEQENLDIILEALRFREKVLLIGAEKTDSKEKSEELLEKQKKVYSTRVYILGDTE